MAFSKSNNDQITELNNLGSGPSSSLPDCPEGEHSDLMGVGGADHAHQALHHVLICARGGGR